jgi:chitinase
MKVLALLALVVCHSCAIAAPAQELPKQLIVGYWHNWTFPNNLRLTEISPEFDVVNIAFATPATPLGADMQFWPSSAIYPNANDFLADVQHLQATGRKVLISIGGGASPVQLHNAADEAVFVQNMTSIIQTWGFDGMDIDLEGSSLELEFGDTNLQNPSTPRIVHFISAMDTLLAQMPADFILTAAPETALVQGGIGTYAGVWGAYLPVLDALRHDLDYVHVQHYNSGSMYGADGNIYTPGTADFHTAMADALISGFNVAGGNYFAPFRPDQVAIGLPASTSAAGSGYTQPAVVKLALEYLYKGQPFGGSYLLADPNGYPSFRGVMTWSVNWDRANNDEFATGYANYFDQLWLRGDQTSLSASTGGTLTIDLSAGKANAQRSYTLVAGASGTYPGTPLPGGLEKLPIRRDTLTERSYLHANNSQFADFQAQLNPVGESVAHFHMPPIPTSYVGRTLHFAYALSNPWDFTSQPIALLVSL